MFGVGASHLALEWNDLPVDVVGLDWRLADSGCKRIWE